MVDEEKPVIGRRFLDDIVGVVMESVEQRKLFEDICSAVHLSGLLVKRANSVSDLLEADGLDPYAAVVISEEYLPSDEIQNCYLTPIICYSSKSREDVLSLLSAQKVAGDGEKPDICKLFNLYEFIEKPGELPESPEEDRLFHALQRAISDKRKVSKAITSSPKGTISVILASFPDKPRFRNIRASLEAHISSQERMKKTRAYYQNMWSSLIERLGEITDIAGRFLVEKWPFLRTTFDFSNLPSGFCANDLLEAGIEKEVLSRISPDHRRELDAYILFFHTEYPSAQEGLIKMDEEVGEGGKVKIPPPVESDYIDFPWIAFRIERTRKYPAYTIALQRYLDAYMFNAAKFKTPKITFPMRISDDYAFWATQFISSGLALNQLIERFMDAKQQHEDPKLLEDLSFSLIKAHAEYVGCWIKNSRYTFVPMPVGTEQRDAYQDGLKDLLVLLGRYTSIQFSDDELALWQEAIKLMGHIEYPDKHIVRNSDASFNNCIFHLSGHGDNLPIEDVVNALTYVTPSSKRKVDERGVARTLYLVDNQYRWGHRFEDIAQILTMFESRFLWEGQGQRPKRDKLVNAHMKAMGYELSEEDAVPLKFMLFYRAPRKLLLMNNYWRDDCIRKKEEIRQQRQKRCFDNMKHYAALGERLASCLADEFRESQTREGADTLAECASLYQGQILLDSSRAQEYMRLICRADQKDVASGARLYAAASVLKKIKALLIDKSCLRVRL